MFNSSLVSKLYLLPEPDHAPKPTQRAYAGLVPPGTSSGIPWEFTAPNKAYRAIVRGWEKYREEVEALDLSYLRNVYEPTEWLFSQFSGACIDKDRFRRFLELDTSGNVASFQPNEKTGMASVPVYDRLATITGRLKVVSGPRLLHLHKIYRSLITSRWKGGMIVALDYQGLEPRLCLAVSGTLPKKGSQQDPYQAVLDQTELPFLTRGFVKDVILSRLYGSSTEAIRAKLNSLEPFQQDNVIQATDSFFGVQQLKEKLREEWEKTGKRYITNLYGRRIATSSDHLLVNHYIQSAGVDVCMLGFTNIVRCIQDSGLREEVLPLFLLHDAIILDVHPNYLGSVISLSKVGSVDVLALEDIVFAMTADKNFNRQENP